MQDTNWLVDPSRKGSLTGVVTEVTDAAKKVLRSLGERPATIVAIAVHANKASM
jgi:hypothetical protein